MYRSNMMYKIHKYEQLVEEASKEVRKQEEIMSLKIPELKRLANVHGDSDNWAIFDSVSDQYKSSKNESAAFENVLKKARRKMEGSMAVEDIVREDEAYALRSRLVASLEQLSVFSSAQGHIVEKVVDTVASFLKNPVLFRKKMMNFMFLGGPGTGKTTIAREIGNVFASAGMFVSGDVAEAGRADFVGQYEGQTVARTRNFLVSNLDNGVIFVDEAYAVTPWDRGKPEGYGLEAATAMVEFMTQYIGLYCIIVAGYETPMCRYFLGANEGMSRRFPHKFLLRNMSAADLVAVFKRKLVESQDLDPATVDGTKYFDVDAWRYLESLIAECTRGKTVWVNEYDDSTRKDYNEVRLFVPEHELAYTIFENQAGSMVNLAEQAVTLLMRSIRYDTWNSEVSAQDLLVKYDLEMMREIVRKQVEATSLSTRDEMLSELARVEEVIGCVNAEGS